MVILHLYRPNMAQEAREAALLFSLQLYVDRVALDGAQAPAAELLLGFQLLQYEIVVFDGAVDAAAVTRLRHGKSCLFQARPEELRRELRRDAEAPLTLLLLARERGRARLRAFAAVPLELHVGVEDGDARSLLRVSEWASLSGAWELRDHRNAAAGRVTGAVTLSCLGKTLAPHLTRALGVHVSKSQPASPRDAKEPAPATREEEQQQQQLGAVAEATLKVETQDSGVQCDEDTLAHDAAESVAASPPLRSRRDGPGAKSSRRRRLSAMSDQRYVKEGWLMKRSRSGRVVSNWRRRYFRLTRTELMYYKTQQDPAPRRRYELTLDSSVLRTNDQGYPLCIVFQPAPGQPSFFMQAESEREKDEWLTAIYNAYRRAPDVAQPQPPLPTPSPEMPTTEPAPSEILTLPQPPPPPAPPARILLSVTVEEARKLKAADFNGKSDPYCVVKLVGKDGKIIDIEEARTQVKTATLEPKWREQFEIGRVVDLNSVKAVRFELWNHDTFKRHDSLGSILVPFSRFRVSPASMAQSDPVDDWFRVEPPKKTAFTSSPRRNDTREKEHVVKDWGELRVRMSISGPNLVDFFHSTELEFVPTSPVATVSNEHTDNRLEVTVIAARDLISSDLNNSSDPYCELSLLDDNGRTISGEYATTAVMHRTRNPAWANEHHIFGLICHIEKAASLKVRVVDYDKSSRNDPLGFVLISLDQLSAHKWTEWHTLQPEEGMSIRENLGAIQLRIWLIGERRGEHARRLKIHKELNTKAHNQSVEQLEYENAQFQLHDAACKLDGARIPCAATDYQARDPRFYGINGCIHYLNTQISRAHQEKISPDEGFQARAGVEGQALLEVTVLQASDLNQGNDLGNTATPYAVIEIDPSVCVEECKRTSAPLSPQKSKRIAAAAGEARNAMFSKRTQAEVSLHRAKLVKNEMRSEKAIEISPDIPVLKVEILTGHGLSPADLNGYSDPYCTLSITDRTTGKVIETEKKRTAVISKTLNPVWAHERFVFGNARSLLIHVKDHNNFGRSTPLGRVEIPLYDLCRASADFTSISSKEVVKRYELVPEPWMKKHTKHLGELCIKTEVVGNATVLAELMQRISSIPMEKSLSILSFSEANIQSDISMDMSMSAADFNGSELEDETTETIQRGIPIRTSTSRVLTKNTASWRKEKFSMSLSYPGIFSDAKYPSIDTQRLQLRIHEARNLLLSDAVGNPMMRTFTKHEAEPSMEMWHQKKIGRPQDAANIFFTVIPVRGDGTLEDAERIQSLTVYNSRDPAWPKEKFVFGRIKDISTVSYLSLHLYGRDVQSDEQVVLSKLLPDEEKPMDGLPKKTLKRFQLHKLTPAGEVDDDGFEILQYDQRVLAFRGDKDGGRFYPARVQKYIPFPQDEYNVNFEDRIETIDDLRNLFSFDVEGVVQAVRNDGRVDVTVEQKPTNDNVSTKDILRYSVMPTQLIPLEKGLTDDVKMVMARRLDLKEEEEKRWSKLQHDFSGITIDIASACNILMPVYDDNGKLLELQPLNETNEPFCQLTLLGNSTQIEHDLCHLNDRGELVASTTLDVSNKRAWEKGSTLGAIVDFQIDLPTAPADGDAAPIHQEVNTPKLETLTNDHESPSQAEKAAFGKSNAVQNNEIVLFQKKTFALGMHPSDTRNEPDTDNGDDEHIDAKQADLGSRLLKMTSSILIRVDAKMELKTQNSTNEMEPKSAKGNKSTKTKMNNKSYVERTIGYAKVDLASLEIGQKELRLEIVPVDTSSTRKHDIAATDSVPYYMSLGSLFVDITTQICTPKQQLPPAATNREDEESRWDRELTTWYNRQLRARPSSIYTRGATWIERRQLLRSSLTPIGNAQIDALHTILVVIMKRIVNILREIRQFEQFEMLSTDEMQKCRLIHTVNADPTSEYIGRAMEKLSPDARKEIVVGLENELLELAGVKHELDDPKPGICREEWVQLRTKRQQLLRENGNFFMSDQTRTSILSVPRSFTGKGIISWILRKPSVLWSDGWKKYAKNSALHSAKLGWDADNRVRGLGALREPTEEDEAVQWMSALCAAGFVENVTPGTAALTDLGKRQVLMESKADRFYRLHEVDLWMGDRKRKNSLFPLDLVEEIDCFCPPAMVSKSTTEKTNNNAKTDACTIRSIYRKKLTEHCDGFLGMHSTISDLLFSVKGWASRLSSVRGKVEEGIFEKTEETSTVVENMLWNWKYCLFMPSRRQLYMYEHEASIYPMAFIDVASSACKVSYNYATDARGGWFDIANPVVYVRKPDSHDYILASTEVLDEMAKVRANGERVLEFKTPHTQRWIHALARSGVCVAMFPGQRVLMKRLNPIVLQQKCNKHATRFKPNDLEGSFHRLLNRLFGHDKELSHQDHEREMRDQRAQLRSELKKAGVEDEVVMAYYGKGKELKSKPMYSGTFKNGSLYSARILRIRTPFTEEHYPFKTKYDIKNNEVVPADLSKLLDKYSVVDQASWMNLPKSLRDMFLLYDVEYSHANERIVEEGMMREHIRTNEGDLDPQKVREKCTDLNIMFKATDLENCVSRMLKHRYRHKPLGVLKIPTTMISPHRTIDAWYPLAPASDMLQKTRLGQIRVELKRVQKREIKRSAKIPPLPESVKAELLNQYTQVEGNPQANSGKTNPKKNQFAVGREPSFVKVSILEGRSLPVADLFTSDPFVEIVLLDIEDSKEHDTDLKTDIKMRTLNPKWENQEFLLGKTEKTMLSDKSGILLRVMDYDATSANDPMGCAIIEFERSETNYIRGVMLKHADSLGNYVTEELKLDEDNRVTVEAMLLPVSGQRRPSPKKKASVQDGLLGKLRVMIEILRNDNYADTTSKLLETSYSAEIAIKKAEPLGDLGEYTCYFQPHGEGGLRIQYIPASEDLGLGNPFKLKDLLSAVPTTGTDSDNASLSREAYKLLGRTYDLAKVDYITMRLVSASTGRVFEGHLGKSDRRSEHKRDGKAEKKPKFSLKTPTQCASFRDETIVLIDQEDFKQQVTLTFDLNLIGILRAERVRRILADTFRVAGFTFDSRTFNCGRYNPDVEKDALIFLWDACRANASIGRNVSEELLVQELLNQVRIMSQATKLHWKVTPQLLAYVFQIVFSGGERDHLSYADAVALDNVLNRWARILSHMNEAKDYSTGNLHGLKTPRLIELLFMECEWTGFDFSALYGDGSTPPSAPCTTLTLHRSIEERMSPIQLEDHVTAQLPFIKHAGMFVDVRLRSGDFVAATIIRECGNDRYDVELTGVNSKDIVFVCSLQENDDPKQPQHLKRGRLARIKQNDGEQGSEKPYLVEFLDNLDPHQGTSASEPIDATVAMVGGAILVKQLQKEDCIRVSEASRETHAAFSSRHSSNVQPRLAKVLFNNGNAQYDIMYIDGRHPTEEKSVPRKRLSALNEDTLYDGKVININHFGVTTDSSLSSTLYSVLLKNGELVECLMRSQLRNRHEFFVADAAFLSATFSSNLQCMDPSSPVGKLNNLWWGGEKVLAVYAVLPSPVKSIRVRHPTTHSLIHGDLAEKSERQSGFVGQYQGFVKGANLGTIEEILANVFTAARKRNTYNSFTKTIPPFKKENCFCLMVAPPPLVQIEGFAQISSSAESEALFKNLVLATLNKTPESVVPLFQRALRAECTAMLQSASKECYVVIEQVTIKFTSTSTNRIVIEVKTDGKPLGEKSTAEKDFNEAPLTDAIVEIMFQLTIPYSNQGNISDAVAVAYEDATTICKRLQDVTALTVDEEEALIEPVPVDKVAWSFASFGKPTISLPVSFTNSSRRLNFKPRVSLEPPEDIRVQACDSDNRVHELHFRILDVLNEARVRRAVTPFIKAEVVSESTYSKEASTSSCFVKYKTNNGKNDTNDAVEVPTKDLKFDMLRIKILEASNMILKEQTGTDGLLVEVLLVSRDFQKHMAADKKIVTPFGVKLSSAGEILPDTIKNNYPPNSTCTLALVNNGWKTSANSAVPAIWKLNRKSGSVDFKYPAVDLDRVSEVKLVVRDKKTHAKVGTVTISMTCINDSFSETDELIPQDEPILRLQREGSQRKRVVGTLSLAAARIKAIGSKSQEVYAKQLKTNSDFWRICPNELLKITLREHDNKLSRSFLSAGPPVTDRGKVVLMDTLEMEIQLQKIANARRILGTIDMTHRTLPSDSVSATPTKAVSNDPKVRGDVTSRATIEQLRQSAKSFVKETAKELGLGEYMIERRPPWSSDVIVNENKQLRSDLVFVEANVTTCTERLRDNVQKLHEMFMKRYIPKLNELYDLDSQGEDVDISKGELLLSFFDIEVDELEYEDQQVRNRLYQRIRLAKLTQVLDMIMRASLRVKLMDEDRNNVDRYLGTACIPLMDLLDQQPHDEIYQLMYLPITNLRGSAYAAPSPTENDRGKVRLRLHFKLSESSFFEQAINIYKLWKAKYIGQHEAARRQIHDTVIPAQRRRWLTIKGYLDDLTKQAKGKLHWERTPVLLSLVWDIFVLHENSPTRSEKKHVDEDELEYTHTVAKMAYDYRSTVTKIHERWVNLQPKLDELLNIQAADLINAQRTPELINDIEREVEGLDVGLSTAWHQVKQKWQVLLDALEELVSMQTQKLNLTRAPQLLKIVEKRCSKGLSTRHAEAVSSIQSRWMAITQTNGPLSELRMMEKKGLHWRRTHELLLLLDEQCEGFSDVDARALDTVQNRWEQVQEWLDEVVQMQSQHSIDCEHTPFILEKIHLWKPSRMKRQDELNKAGKRSTVGIIPPSPKSKDEASGRQRGFSHQSSSSRLSSEGSFRSDGGVEDNGQLEGMIEWYAIEEAKYELERIPYHRINTDTDKKNWLPYSRGGKDIRLLITQQEMVFTAANVRFALEERGVIPTTSNFDPMADTAANVKDKYDAWTSPTLADPKSGSQSVTLPIAIKAEIEELEKVLEKRRDDNQPDFSLPNPERVAELYKAIESLGKTDLLWNVDHVVSKNRELAVPDNYQQLLREMSIRQIPTTEVENLVKSLVFTMQKEVLIEKGITVPATTNPTALLQIMHRYQITEVTLPKDISSIQTRLQERGMDRKGDPVMLRGVRIGTQSTGAASVSVSSCATSAKAINTGLGIVDTQIELLRKTLLLEALRKRNSLIRTFAGESHILDEESERMCADIFAEAVENAEVDVSGDYLTLVERFQRQLVHESYTRRLAEYAALDRCMRALLQKNRDEVVTKEEIAMELHNVNKRVAGANYRLPPEAFTAEELTKAASAGRIRSPSKEILARCPKGNNASAMAYYAAISYAANVYQEVTSFRARVDPSKNRLLDAFPFGECSTLDGVAIPKQLQKSSFSQSIADWLLGFDTSELNIKRKLSAAHRQRLEWASAAFTLRNRWLQCGLGWSDHIFGEGVGVKVLLDRLLLFEAANKMDMVKTEMLLREVRDKCSRLRDREQEAQAKLEDRYQANLELLEKLVMHAERCMNNRKLHSEETPVLLHKLEQVCVVPSGLNDRHREAYHTVATHWLPQQQHLSELMKMHGEGTFSISRTPELLGKMKYHTEGKAGSEELNEDKVAASAQRVAPELQATFVDRKLNEIRLGQRKEASSLHLDLSEDEEVTNQLLEDSAWKELSHSERVVQPLSPHEKQTSWKLVKNAVAANTAFSAGSPRKDKADRLKVDIGPKATTQPASPRRKLSVSEELKVLLLSPTQWLTGPNAEEEAIAPELYFPKEVVLETSGASLSGPTK
ncbi:unnamed protein product [Phytophthora fragariaefolia]|uniref:Unnamed protein product n=1 Tax=Phytophthora fragariaefolia TaxID=1490495 RepID=A0A9W6X9I4_9STRA|nr:unnamed protein product [Phytophthora fragariaefolia]